MEGFFVQRSTILAVVVGLAITGPACGRRIISKDLIAKQVENYDELVVQPNEEELLDMPLLTGGNKSGSMIADGNRARGRLKDWLLQNDKIKVIISNVDEDRADDRYLKLDERSVPHDRDPLEHSDLYYDDRSVGVDQYGGVIIDADVRRPPELVGKDGFGALVPLVNMGIMLRGLEIGVLDDGYGGDRAAIRVRGDDVVYEYFDAWNELHREFGEAPFPYNINEDFEDFVFETDYTVYAGENYVNIETRLINLHESNTYEMMVADVFDPGPGDLFIPMPAAASDTNIGLGFGRTNEKITELVDWFAMVGDELSYGYVPPHNENWGNLLLFFKGVYVLVPYGTWNGFVGGVPAMRAEYQFGNAFTIGPDSYVSWKRQFVVSDDGANMTLATSLFTREQDYAGVKGQVIVEGTKDDPIPIPNADISVMVVDEAGRRPWSHTRTDEDGVYLAILQPGRTYHVAANAEGYPYEENQPLPNVLEPAPEKGQILSGEDIDNISLPAPGKISFVVQDGRGNALPAKVSILGIDPSPEVFDGTSPFRDETSDMPGPGIVDTYCFEGYVRDDNSPLASEMLLEPGTYTFVASRGPEYSIDVINDVVVSPATTSNMVFTIDRVVPTQQTVVVNLNENSHNYFGMDFRIHTQMTPGGQVATEDRLRQALCEGLEYVVSSDVGYTMDLYPFLDKLFYTHVLRSAVGEEISSATFGDFFGWPLATKLYPVGRDGGAFDTANDHFPAMGPKDIMTGMNPALRQPWYGDAGDISGVEVLTGLSRPAADSPDAFFTDIDARMDYNTGHVFAGPNARPIYDYRVLGGTDMALTKDAAGQLEYDLIEIFSGQGHEFDEAALNRELMQYFRLLNIGQIPTLVGSADTLLSSRLPVGYPRTYVALDAGTDVGNLTVGLVNSALAQNWAFVTTAPFVSMVFDAPGGSAQTGQASDFGGTISLGDGNNTRPNNKVNFRLTINSALWARVDTIEVYSNTAVDGIDPADLADRARDVMHLNYELPQGDGEEPYLMEVYEDAVTAVTVTLNDNDLPYYRAIVTYSTYVPEDTWFVFKITGEQSIYPVVGSYHDDKTAEEALEGFRLRSLTGGVRPIVVTNAVFVHTVEAGDPEISNETGLIAWDPPCPGPTCPDFPTYQP